MMFCTSQIWQELLENQREPIKSVTTYFNDPLSKLVELQWRQLPARYHRIHTGWYDSGVSELNHTDY